jgi:hypothetical protein
MAARFIPELSYYRTWHDRLRALRVMVSQIRVVGLVLPPGLMALAGFGWLALQVLALAAASSRSTLMFLAVSAGSWLFLASVVGLAALRRTRPALRRDLIRRGYRVCLRCGYDLGGTGDAPCPECGDSSTELLSRAWEPQKWMALYPELSACSGPHEAAACLERARARAGMPHLTLAGLLGGALAGWFLIIRGADAIAYHYRRDLPTGFQQWIILPIALSMVFIASGWYWCTTQRVRARIPAALADLRRTPPTLPLP